ATSAAALADLTPFDLEPAITQLLAGGTIAARGTDRVAPPPTVETLPLLALAATPIAAPATPPPAPKTAGRLRIYEPGPPTPAPVEDDGLGLGLRGLVVAEESLASGLRALAGRPSGVQPSAVDRWLAEDTDARQLSSEQRAAV